MMVHIRELEHSEANYVESISELHKRAFPDFFLTKLGVSFLRTLYRCYLENEDSGIIIAEEKGKIVGFIAYSYDYPNFYKSLIKEHLLEFALCSLKAAVIHPSFTKRILRAFKKSESVIKEEPYVELASICVDPRAEGKGYGSMLINYIKAKVNFNKYAYINLETDAENNKNVNIFYIKNGFQIERTFTTAEGRKMNEYRYLPGGSC